MGQRYPPDHAARFSRNLSKTEFEYNSGSRLGTQKFRLLYSVIKRGLRTTIMLFEETQRRILRNPFTAPGGGGKTVPDSILPAVLAAALWVLVSVLPTAAYPAGLIDEVDISGRLSTESWLYPQSAAYPDQRSYAGGLALETTFYAESEEGTSIAVTPFLRYDAGDPDRTYGDFREAYLLMYGDIGNGEWELRLGIDRVFWGVAELRSLVDIINQTNVIEHPNEKIKMGQPMAHFTWSGDWGALEFFAMTWHRARTYPGRCGRQRYEFLVDQDMISYESGAKKWHIDLASRYSGPLGPLEIGLSLFNGTNREPALLPVFLDSGLVLAPHYEKIRQFGVDAQLARGSLLLKLEAIYRAGAKNSRFIQHLNTLEEEDYTAFILGSEYTLYSILGSNSDLVLFAEWTYDGRGRWATNAFENDLFVAARLGLNDPQSTEFVVSVFGSLNKSSRVVAGEFKRRLSSDNWLLHIETSAFLDIAEEDFIYYVRRDSYVKINLAYSF